ncbi:MAG: PIN domain-containing protein [Pyrinomonadaceae bacterium]|jgi:predicted nucleic acid-binding protein|nr:PIN domain-containing protein [Pyrinomonadaceae bacterium]
MKVLLDTDVNLDFILQRQPFFVEAEQVFLELIKGKFEAYICDITPLNIFYIAKKEFGNDKTRLEISKLLQLVEVCIVNRQILQNALTSTIKDYEDAVQNESAIAENLDAIVTRNTKDFANSTIKVYTPSEFLQTI